MGNKLRSRWPVLFSFIIVVLFISYYLFMQSVDPSDRTYFVLACGILGIALIVFLTLYMVRKNVFRYRLGSTESWLQAHIYVGIVSLVVILMHSGFDITGKFSMALLTLFLLVFISGIVGALIYKTIPLSMTKYGRNVKTENEIFNDMEKYLKEADRLVSNASGELREIYHKKMRPFYRSRRTKWEYLFMEERELINKRRNMIEGCKKLLPDKDVYDLNILGSILIEKEKISFMWTKKRVLKAWLNLHMPLSTAMITMSLFHILSILYF